MAWNRPFGLSLYTSSPTGSKVVRAWLSHAEDHKPGEKRPSSVLFPAPLPVLSFEPYSSSEERRKNATKKKGTKKDDKKKAGKRKDPGESSESEESDEGEHTQKKDEREYRLDGEDEDEPYARFRLTVRRADVDSETDPDEDDYDDEDAEEDCREEDHSLEGARPRATKRRAVARRPTLLRRLAEEILIAEKRKGGKGGVSLEKNYDLFVDTGEQRPIVITVPLRIMDRKNFQGKGKARFQLHNTMDLSVETRKTIFTLKKQ